MICRYCDKKCIIPLSIIVIISFNNIPHLYLTACKNSSWNSLLLIIVYVYRSMIIFPHSAIISVSNLAFAENIIFDTIENVCFSLNVITLQDNKQSSFSMRNLYIFIDNGILRVGDRLKNASLVYYHRFHCHIGSCQLLSLLQPKRWLPSPSRCNYYFKLKLMLLAPAVDYLSVSCIQMWTAVYYSEPLEISYRSQRGTRSHKFHEQLFACSHVRVLNVELADELSTCVFLNAFILFICIISCFVVICNFLVTASLKHLLEYDVSIEPINAPIHLFCIFNLICNMIQYF